MKSNLNLYTRDGVYYWRRRLPAFLEKIVGKFVIRISTRTHIPGVARAKSNLLAHAADVAFESLSRNMNAISTQLNASQLQKILSEIFSDAILQAEQERACHDLLSEDDTTRRAANFQTAASDYHTAFRGNNLVKAWPILKSALQKNGLVLNEENPTCRLAAAKTLQVLATANEKLADQERGTFISPAFAGVVVDAQPTPVRPVTLPTVQHGQSWAVGGRGAGEADRLLSLPISILAAQMI